MDEQLRKKERRGELTALDRVRAGDVVGEVWAVFFKRSGKLWLTRPSRQTAWMTVHGSIGGPSAYEIKKCYLVAAE